MEELIPKELKKNIPDLYSTEDSKDPIVYIKLFIDSWTWYITELSSKGDIAFGYVVSPFGSELGYFSLKEILEVKGSLGTGVERDELFVPIKLSKVRDIK